MSEYDERLDRPLNIKDLADALLVSRTYVSAMVKAGFKLRFAGRGTLRDARNWLEEHQDFRVRASYPEKSATSRSGVRHGLRGDKCGEPSLTNG